MTDRHARKLIYAVIEANKNRFNDDTLEALEMGRTALEQPTVDVLEQIRAEIEQAADKQFQIAMGVSDLNERYAHIQMENAYRHSLNIIDKYIGEQNE